MVSGVAATILALSTLVAGDPPAEAKTAVRVITVHEVRHKDLRESPPKSQFGSVNPDAQERLSVTIELTGDAAPPPRRQGHPYGIATFKPSCTRPARPGLPKA